MNIFRLFGDMAHLGSILILLLKLRASKSAAGVSLKTQELFLLVFVFRYLDLFTRFYSLYNSCMKIVYISSTGYIVYMIRQTLPIKATYDKTQDSFKHLAYAVAPCAVLAVITSLIIKGFRVPLLEITWEFSIYLEAMAIVPQLIVLQRYRDVENLTGHYVFLLGVYRGLYVLNWIYRASYEKNYHTNWVQALAGVVQTALYVDFFYYYMKSKATGSRLSLPS